MKRIALCLLALLWGCGGPPQTRVETDDVPHLGMKWFEHRANTLGIELNAAEVRDSRIGQPGGLTPDDALDSHTAREATVIWKALCASCHGIDGQPPNGVNPKPRKWTGMGPAMGFFFGGDKMRAAIFRKISEGVPPAMPAWKPQLSREQIWAVVRHIEGF